MEENKIEILCRNREELIDDYLMVVTEMDRSWCEEMAVVYETLSDGDLYPAVFSAKEDLVLD